MLLTLGVGPSLVPRMRSSLHLAFLLLEGRLFSDVPRRDFDLEMGKTDDARLPEDVPKIEKRRAIKVWFGKGGDCPFTDEAMTTLLRAVYVLQQSPATGFTRLSVSTELPKNAIEYVHGTIDR